MIDELKPQANHCSSNIQQYKGLIEEQNSGHESKKKKLSSPVETLPHTLPLSFVG